MKKNNNIIDHGTFNLVNNTYYNSFDIDIKYEQARDNNEHFRISIWYKSSQCRPGTELGYYLVSLSPFGTMSTWLGCFELDSTDRHLIEEVVIKECKELYRITSMSVEEFLNA